MKWRRFAFFGPDRGAELINKITAAQRVNEVNDKLVQLYTILTILDTKATGLLTVNAFLIAALVAFLASADQIKEALGFLPPRGILRAQLVALSISAFLCLLVVRVTWKFMWYVPETASVAADFDGELRRLANVIDDRTHYYWVAWLFALVGIALCLAWWHRWAAWVAFGLVILWAHRRG
jgi:hypothetical protein